MAVNRTVGLGPVQTGSRAAALLWAAVGSSVGAWMAGLEPSLLEEGMIVHVAERLADGERLYRDVSAFSGPLPFELLAALFGLFGAKIAVARTAVAVLQGAACGALFLLARRAAPAALGHAAAALLAASPVLLFPFFSIFFYATLAVQLGVLAAYATERGRESTAAAIGAGVLIAFVALCKQTIGLVLAPALLAAVVATARRERRFRAALGLTVGGASVALVTLLVFGVRGDLGALVRSLVALPLSLGSAYSVPFPNLWPPTELSPHIAAMHRYYVPHLYNLFSNRSTPGATIAGVAQALYALPFLALLATGARGAAGRLSDACWIHAALLVALCAGIYPRPDWGHLVFALPAAAVQLVLALSSVEAGAGTRRTAALAASAGLTAALAAATVFTGLRLSALSADPSFGPRVPQRPVSEANRSPAVPRVIDFVRRRAEPGEPIFVARAEPLIYFATGTRNPTRFSGVLPGLREIQESTILASLPEVRFVVMSDVDQPVFLTYREELPGVQRYLERHFRVPREFAGLRASWILVLERGPDRGATAIDLFDRAHTARRWIRDDDGAERAATGDLPKLATRLNRRPLPIELGPGGGGIDFDLDVPTGARFQAGIGLGRARGPTRWHTHPAATRLEVRVGLPGSRERVAAADVMRRKGDGGRWTELEADLSAWSGDRVTLRLELSSKTPLRSPGLAWWGSPRLALPPGGE